MSKRKEALKQTLGISEYPWSSDDDDDDVLHRHYGGEPQSNVADMPGTSGLLPSSSSSVSPTRRGQARVERDLYWNFLNNNPGGLLNLTRERPRHNVEEISAGTRLSPLDADIQRIREFQNIVRLSNSSAVRLGQSSSHGSAGRRINNITTRRNNFRPRRILVRANADTLPSSTNRMENPALDLSATAQAPSQNYIDNEREGNPTTVDVSLEEIVEFDPEPESALEARPEPEPEPEPELEAQPEIQPEPQPDPQQEPEQELRPEPEADRERDADRNIAPRDTANEEVVHVTDDGDESEQQHRQVKKKTNAPNVEGCDSYTAKDLNQSLLRLLECPVCLEWMEPPLGQCRRGHVVCAACRARLSACPVCRTAFSSVRNRAMEGVCETVRYPCRHGCGHELRLRGRALHEASCASRRYPCPLPSCAGRPPLPRAHLAHHIQNRHASRVRTGSRQRLSVRLGAALASPVGVTAGAVVENRDDWVVRAHRELFHVRATLDARPITAAAGLMLTVVYIGPQCNAKNYFYQVTVTGSEHARKLVYSRSTHSDMELSAPSAQNTLSVPSAARRDCFHLTMEQTAHYVRYRSRLGHTMKYLDFILEITNSELAETKDNADS